MEDDVYIGALTMDQYITLILDGIIPGIVNPKIGDDVEFLSTPAAEFSNHNLASLYRPPIALMFHGRYEKFISVLILCPLSFKVDNDIENLTLTLNPYSWIKGWKHSDIRNGWIGVSTLQALFILEHNAVCDTLKLRCISTSCLMVTDMPIILGDLFFLSPVMRRWKEQYFVNVGSDCGLTIAGFYYVCFSCVDGSINGYYYDPNSSSALVVLTLTAIFPNLDMEMDKRAQ
ncbi:vacuolar import/degradation protein Vid24, partial [Tanacetum coccineum]